MKDSRPQQKFAPSRMTVEEWRARGIELFGEDMAKWRFVCPGCKHVQVLEDFRPYKDRGATPDSVRMECIGRYSGGRSWANGRGPGPCDYAGYGLFRISPVVVVDGENELHAFAFAEEAATPAP